MIFFQHVPMILLFGSSNELDSQLLLKGFLAMLFLGIGIETILQFIPAVSKYIYYESNKVLFLSDWIKWLLPVILFIFVGTKQTVFCKKVLGERWVPLSFSICFVHAFVRFWCAPFWTPHI